MINRITLHQNRQTSRKSIKTKYPNCGYKQWNLNRKGLTFRASCFPSITISIARFTSDQKLCVPGNNGSQIETKMAGNHEEEVEIHTRDNIIPYVPETRGDVVIFENGPIVVE